MMIQSKPSRLFGVRHTACGATVLTALFVLLPLRSLADSPAAPDTASSVSDVSLSDLNLSTAEGLRAARARLETMAERVCSSRGGAAPSAQPGFTACVDTTVTSALRRIETLAHNSPWTVRNSVTVAQGVSLGDLDLSTLEGAHIARQRLESMARRVCADVTRRRDLSNPPDYAACLHDTFAGAMAQAEAIAARNQRVAQRAAP